MKKRLTAAFLAACTAMQLCTLLPVSAAELKDAGLNYKECTAYDLEYPDCGFTSTPWINAAPGKIWTNSPTRYTLLLIGIAGYSSAMNADGTDYDFDEAFFTSLEETLKNARRNGAMLGIRFRYDAEGKEKPEPATFEQVLRHIEQIGESGLLTEYADVISFVETGMVGCWGEQWGGKYTSLEHKAQVLDAFLNITPDNVAVTVRTPNTMRQWLKDYCGIETTAADMSYAITDPVLAAKAARIGMYNDGYMGSDSDLGTYSNRAGETAWLHDAPAYGGEFSGSDEWRLKYTTWQPEFALPEMYYTNLMRINSNIYRTRKVTQNFSTAEEAQARLDAIRKLYEDCGLGDYDEEPTMTANEDGTYTAGWKWMGYDDFTFDEKLDALLDVDCDNSAFYGESVYQFMRAHLGYRYVLRESRLTAQAKAGGDLELDFTVENTGFSEAPRSKELEVLLTNGDIVYTYPAPLADARDWASGSRNELGLFMELPETMPGGEWDVYLRISEENADPAYDTAFAVKFANEDLQFSEELQANFMGSVTIDGEPDAQQPENPDTREAGYYPEQQAIPLNETDTIHLLDKVWNFKEDGHFGFTFLYKMEGVTAPVQLGNWYAGFTLNGAGYGSAYTTYGLNTRNQTIEKDGYYAMHIPFFGCVFNCPDISTTAGNSFLSAFSINDGRNYWSADTFTALNGVTGASITPLGFVEGGCAGYDVTFHLPDGDVQYTGTYGFKDTCHQSITNLEAVTVLSLLDRECPETDAKDNAVYRLLGFTTRKGDKTTLIDEDFIAMGTVELYPYYEMDKERTDFDALVFPLTNRADAQGVRYAVDGKRARIGDFSGWENSSGLVEGTSLVIPSAVSIGSSTYPVSQICNFAFWGTDVKEVVLPGEILSIGENAFPKDAVIYTYADSATAQALADTDYHVEYLTADKYLADELDVNMDGKVNVADIIALQRFLFGEKVAIDLLAANRVRDGAINAFDLAMLKRLFLDYKL